MADQESDKGVGAKERMKVNGRDDGHRSGKRSGRSDKSLALAREAVDCALRLVRKEARKQASRPSSGAFR